METKTKERFNTLSGILFFMAFMPYVWAIVKHYTVPSPISWAVWSSVDILVLLAMRKKGAQIGQISGAVAGALVITTLALFYGKPAIGTIEWISVAGAFLGIMLWQNTGNALFAVICSQTATFAGAFPTFATAYAEPGKEDPLSWSIWLVSCVCALIAVKKWDVANALQPLTFTAIETIMVVLVVIRPHL